MEKWIRNLGMLLAAQCLLAVVLFFSGPDLVAVRPDTPLLDIGDVEVDRLVIEGDGGKQVLLQKTAAGWQLPHHHEFPANTAKIEGLLRRLKNLKHGMPVATSDSAIDRFKVAKDGFERRITLGKGGDDLATVFLGTSPGVRRVHARTAKDEAVFSVDLATHEAPFEAEAWENKEILHIPQAEIEQVQVSGLTLDRQKADKPEKKATDGGKPPAWKATGLQEGESLNIGAVETLVQKLANLRIGKILGNDDDQKQGPGDAAVTITLVRKGTGKIDYRLGKAEGGEYHVVKSTLRREYFRIPNHTGEAILKAASRDALVNRPDPKEDKSGRKEAETVKPQEKPPEKLEKP